VYPKSPAEKAGLKVGDRIMKMGVGTAALVPLDGRQKSGRDQLMDMLNPLAFNSQVQLEVVRKGVAKPVVVKVQLESLPDTKVQLVPDVLPEETASAKKARMVRVYIDAKTGKPVRPKPAKKDDAKKDDGKDDEKKDDEKETETGLLEKTDASGQHKYYVYVH